MTSSAPPAGRYPVTGLSWVTERKMLLTIKKGAESLARSGTPAGGRSRSAQQPEGNEEQAGWYVGVVAVDHRDASASQQRHRSRLATSFRPVPRRELQAYAPRSHRSSFAALRVLRVCVAKRACHAASLERRGVRSTLSSKTKPVSSARRAGQVSATRCRRRCWSGMRLSGRRTSMLTRRGTLSLS